MLSVLHASYASTAITCGSVFIVVCCLFKKILFHNLRNHLYLLLVYFCMLSILCMLQLPASEDDDVLFVWLNGLVVSAL